MYTTNTRTNTYTVIDVRKTFEGFEADLRTIARRTGRWSMKYVANVFHDILLLAENDYIECVSIVLIASATKESLRAAKYIVNTDGTVTSSDGPGKNTEWINDPDTTLSVVLTYTDEWHDKTSSQKETFQKNNDFKIGWSTSSIDTNFPNLSRNQRQLYASSGYELQKMDYK